ncbi:DNA polymerase III subunit gamma/tau [Orlajensenia leifsoniae]|uniref:DNA polymerase III subunit gamma/tau n=1 Tax=Orlajensenia leifsoniae TaxID=2561933 RepID=A0A4Y9QUA2_9MICO|nr:DNA polymerase III subunit gamma/tau [Leifsonia flava]TFV95132.1 DNA polymerase III subunit gamma/tau [Leifsonia flava]
MAAARDDDALNWAGDDDPTLVAKDADALAPGRSTDPEAPAGAELPSGWTPVGEPGRVTHPDAAADTDDGPAQTSSATLITLGVLGGIYLIYTIGWAVVATRMSTGSMDPVAQFMFVLGTWLAILAVPLWFAVTLWLTGGRPRRRLLWLFAGVVLLVPLPFLLGTGVAS